MKPKSKWAAILLGVYIHGLTLYFTLSSLVGIRSSIVTGIYQLALVIVPLLIVLSDKEARQKLFKFGVVDALYLAFIVMVVYDLIFPSETAKFPENLTIYFSVYWLALTTARSLTFSQFKVFCYTASIAASLTSLILFVQTLAGGATLVNNGTRIAAGSSGNPILAGYTGAFAFLSSLILWITGKTFGKAVWLVVGAPGLYVCTLSGTRSATLSILLSASLIGVYVLNILFSSGKTSFRFFSNAILTGGILLSGLVLLDPVMAFLLPTKRSNEPSLVAKAIDQGVSRIDILFQVAQGGKGDASIQGRQEMYQHAWDLFLKNPIWGNGLYSTGSAHNAFLQVASEFGLFGILAFTLPLIFLIYQLFKVILADIMQLDPRDSLKHPQRFIRSDYAMMTGFTIVFLIQALCMFGFHGDPYRSYLPVCSIGVLVAFVRLSKREIRTNISSN